jgi:hypothetical protein
MPPIREFVMNPATQAVPVAPLSRLNKAGLILAALLGVGEVVSLFFPTPDGEVGPPLFIVVLDGVLGLFTMVAVVVAWRTARRGAVRLVAGARVISVITALPAFFVDGVPAGVKVAVGVFVMLSVAVVAMLLAPTRERTPVTD